VDAKSQLRKLFRIQELAQETLAAQLVVDQAPHKIEEIEAHFRERNAEYVAIKEQFEALQQDQSIRSGELTDLEAQQEKYKDGLMEVKNQREYAAMLKEIDVVKAEIAGHEDAILKNMEALEKTKGELATHEEHIQKERVDVEKQRTGVQTAAARAAKQVAALTKERNAIETKLPDGLNRSVARLEASRQGVFLAKSENGTCLSCFVRIRPQVFQEIKASAKLHNCENCRRFLYYEPSVNPQESSAADAPSADAPSNVEAVNGGAV
jgi:predicted  nucleic acid-binding Zn-ribbon protein